VWAQSLLGAGGAALPAHGAAGGGTRAPRCHRRGPGRRRPAQLLARTGAARRRHPTLARAERPEQRCSATGASVLGAGPGRGVLLPPSLPPSILRPAQWLCRPCPPPSAWLGPGRRLLDHE